MRTTLRFHGGDLAGECDLDDPSTPQDVLDFWSATGGQVGETYGLYLLAGLFSTGLDEQRGEVLLVGSNLGQAILLGLHPPLAAPLRARIVGGGPLV